MIVHSRLTLCGLLAGVLALGACHKKEAPPAPEPSRAQSSRTVPSTGARKGQLAGPDLAGVTNRRSQDWLKRWLKDPTAMLDSDSTAKELLKQAKGVKMPNMKLDESAIDALIAYLAQH
jgi:Cytochrome c